MRVRGWIGLALLAAVLLVLLAIAVAASPPGTRWIVGKALAVANSRLDGSISVRHVDGSVLRRLSFEGLEVRDPDGVTVAAVRTLEIGYSLLDLIRGRFVFHPVIVEAPTITLLSRASGEGFTLADIGPSRAARAEEGAGRLVALESLEIRDGAVIVRRGAEPAIPAWMPDSIFAIGATIPLMQLSSADPRAPMVVDVASLRAESDEPLLSLRHGRVRAEVGRDTVRLVQLRLESAQSQLEAQGWFVPDTTLAGAAYEVVATIASLSTNEVAAIAPRLPPDLVLNGVVEARSRDPDGVQLRLDGLTVTAVADSGAVEANGTVIVHPPRAFRIEQVMRVEARRFHTAHLGAFVDSVPLAGWVDGTLRLRGTRDALELDARASLREPAGVQMARLEAVGGIAVPDGDTVRFRDIRIRTLRANLDALRRAGVPVTLGGRLEVGGALNGHLFAPRFSGSIIHRGPTGRTTTIRGTLGGAYGAGVPAVMADLLVDSLRLGALASLAEEWQLRGALGGEVRFRGTLDSLPFEFRLAGTPGEIDGNGILGWHGDSLALDDTHVALVGFDASGVSGRAMGTRVNAAFDTERVVAVGSATRGRVNARLEPSEIADIAIDSARGRVSLEPVRVAVESLAVFGAGFGVTGAGDVALDTVGQQEWTIHVDLDSAAILEPLLGGVDSGTPDPAQLAGALALDLRLDGTRERYRLEASVTAPSLGWGTLRGTGVRGDATWVNEDRAVELVLQADSVQTTGSVFTAMRASASGGSDRWGWSVAATAAGAGPWAGAGHVLADSVGYRVTLDSLALRLWESAWTADSGGTLDLQPGRIAATLVLRRRDGEGRIAVDGVLPSADSGHVEVAVERVPLRELLRLTRREPSRFDGRLDARLRVDGRADTPRYRVTAALSDVTVDTTRLPAPRIEMEYGDRRARGSLVVTHQGRELLRGEGALPIDVTFPFTVVRSDSGQLAVTLTMDSVPGTLIGPLLPNVRDLRGALMADVRVRGTPSDPDWEGHLELRNGSLALPALGTRYEQIDGRLRFAGDSVSVDALTLRSGNGGTGSAAGVVRLTSLNDPVLQLEITGSDLAVINSEEYSGVRTTGRVRVGGSFWSPTLTGRLTVGTAVLHLNDVVQRQVVDLGDTLFARFIDTTVLREQELGAPLVRRLMDSLRIDGLEVTLGPDVWFRTAEANVQLGGEVTVNKVGTRYPVQGTIRVVRGTYRMALGGAATREFAITTGEIRFFGTDSLDAVLDIDARHTVRTVRGDNMVVFAHISGTIARPTVTLSSDRTPAIPETEIISYLMFGAPSVQVFAGSRGRERRSVFEAGAKQFTQLLAGQLERSFSGLADYFAIAPGDPGDAFAGTEILVGKQLELFGRPSFLTVSPRLCPRQPLSGLVNLGLSLETWLTQHWLLDASVDPRRSCGASTTPTASDYQVGVDFLWVIQ